MKTFQEQFDKLVNAYANNEIEPNKPCACFIGNLLDGESCWYVFKDWSISTPPERFRDAFNVINEVSDSTYSPKELLQIEGAFMRVWERYGENEESLFKAFEHALILLRKLHESKGEVIKDYAFKKRELTESF
jgi:hypothetical protein